MPGKAEQNQAEEGKAATGETAAFGLFAAASGEWLPAEELHLRALAAVSAHSDVSVFVEGVDHLDASSLQILLALDFAQQEQGQSLRLVGPSPSLRRWFEYAGARRLLAPLSSPDCAE